ncbi:NUDIX hydrolase [Sporosarcina sp. CAU 1771]
MEMERKVLAYITIGDEPDWKILVFTQENRPGTGFQVPGGTIERDELVIDALYREIKEETGIEREELELKGKVNKTNYYPENKNTIHERTIFHLSYIGVPRDSWRHIVEGGGGDEGFVFHLSFVPVNELPKLSANQDQAIVLL